MFHVFPKGQVYSEDLQEGLTNHPGIFEGTWESKFPGMVFPNYIVAVGAPLDSEGNGVYSWSIEFQCVEEHNAISFIGVNFYSRYPREDPRGATAEKEMQTAAAKLGVFEYTGGREGMATVVHAGCDDLNNI